MKYVDILEAVASFPTKNNLAELVSQYNIPVKSIKISDSKIDLYYDDNLQLPIESKKFIEDIKSGEVEHKYSISIYHLFDTKDPYKYKGFRIIFTKVQSSKGVSLELRVPKFLYHITSGQHDNEIRREGLKPQRQNYSIPDEKQTWSEHGAIHRSYTALHLTSTPSKILHWLGVHKQSNTFVKVDTELCKKYNIKFYNDINWDGPGNAVVTFDPIPPNCIVKMWHGLGFKEL